MKIAEIHLYQHQLPVLNGPYVMANAEVWSLTTTIVKLVSDAGVVGWGEVCPVGPTYAEAHAGGALAALQEMAPGLIGASLWPVPLHHQMESRLNGHNYAKAAIDIAAHDVLGKTLGVSVAQLIGGALSDRVPSYFAMGVGEPNECARIAREKAREGYPRLQVKLGGRPVEADVEALHKVWEAISGTGTRLAADGNRGWTTRETLHISRSCPDIRFIIEQPCNSIDDLRTIRPLLQHPLYMDENAVNLATAIAAAGSGLVDGFGMKIGRIGGFHPMRAFRDMCSARNLPHTCDDAWGGDIVSAACTLMAATVLPKLMEGAWLAAPYVEGHYDGENGISIEGGHIAVPKGPGLGIEPDEAVFGQAIASIG